MKTAILISACLLAAGCAVFRKQPAIAAPGVTVTAPADSGKPATLDTAKAGESLPIPAGSRLTVTKFGAVAFIPATVNAPEQPAQPAKEVVQIDLGGASVWTKTAETVRADTGTVDTSVAKAKIEAAESRILLYAALGCLVVAGAFFWMHYPTPAMLAAAASGVLFLCWKVSGLPPWFWGVAVAALAIGGGLYFGHERGEKAAAQKPNTDAKTP